MSAVAAANQALLQIVRGPKPNTIDDAVQVMTRIQAVLPAGDGLAWFNWLYLEVTKAVRNQPATVVWKDPAWMTRLDVVFANFYFSAIESALASAQNTPKSWDVLFQSRFHLNIDRIQFALAGMNAHINHDLSLALIETNRTFGITPSHLGAQHSDFEHVNTILESLLPVVLKTLATGLLGQVLQDSGKIGRLLAMWNVRAARDLAWEFSNHLRSLNGPPHEFALSTQDQLTGAIGRSILLMV